jgi:hypothetical protein
MKKGRRRMADGLLWAWLVLLALGDWRSSVGVAAAFAAVVVWQTVRDLKASRPQTRRSSDRKSASPPTPHMAPVRDS